MMKRRSASPFILLAAMEILFFFNASTSSVDPNHRISLMGLPYCFGPFP